MSHVFIRHKVKNYNNWKQVFDKFVNTRQAGGEKSYSIFHPTDDSNNLYLLFEWDNLSNAKKFMSSSDLKTAMQNAGVTEAPEIQFLEEVAQGITAPSYASV